jgi:hypothetical protein
VRSHGLVGRGLSLRQSSGPLEHGPGMPYSEGQAEWRWCVPVDHWRGRPEGCGPRRLCWPVQASGAWPRDRECLWITSLACLKVAAWQSRDHAGLCRPEGHGLAEIMCLWIAGLAGLRGTFQWRLCSLRGGSLGEILEACGGGPGGAEKPAGQSEIPWPVEQ